MKLVYEKFNALVYFHKKHKILHLKWISTNCREGYLEVIKALIKLTIELKVEGWLFDFRNCQLLPAEVVQENIKYIGNALSQSKLKKFARLVSKDLNYEMHARENIDQINKEFFLGVEVAYFTNELDALSWMFDAIEGDLLET